MKTRVVAQGQQVVRYDREKAGGPGRRTLDEMLEYLTEHLPEFDAVIVSDYAKGVVNEQLMIKLHQLLKDLRSSSGRLIPLIVDPKPENLHRFIGATVITPNNFEAARISGIEIIDEHNLLAAAQKQLLTGDIHHRHRCFRRNPGNRSPNKLIKNHITDH
ncbi:MAG: hypothetical protein D3924_01185 [Candidatus Electrothrix sp. AR4]|nr:hypothetical protein [Candidatus Electrothrix sp. AR4]